MSQLLVLKCNFREWQASRLQNEQVFGPTEKKLWVSAKCKQVEVRMSKFWVLEKQLC
jgi:hypothetical protein